MVKPEKKRMARAVSASLEPLISGLPTFRLSIHDQGDPAIPAPFSGHAEISGTSIATVYGTIEGLAYRPIKPSGAPPKTARNMAVLLAYQWHLLADRLSPHKAQIATAGLWMDNKYKGIKDDSHVRARAKNAEQLLPIDAVFLASKGNDEGKGQASVVMESANSIQRTDKKIILSGPGWIWVYGEEEARHVRFFV